MEEFTNPSGHSLSVASVQELVKQNMFIIPSRYIQPENENLLITEGDQILDIPVIDMQRLLSIEFGSSELAKLDLACKEWGFFQLVNHGVSSSLMEKVKLEIQDFFNLPMSEKRKFWQSPQHLEGFGQAFVFSEDQILDWADMFFMITLPKHMRLPHLFPKLPLPFRDTMEIYSQELENVTMAIVAHMEKALKMEEMEMTELFKDGTQSMRMNYYPPCPQPEKVIGITNHSDRVGLTILLQVNEVDGLQIKKEGLWGPVKPLPNAFIVNIGDMLEIITNGVYPSVEHRAIVNSEKERLSIATFCAPRLDAVIGPSGSLITEQRPAQFKRIGVKEYFKGRFSCKLEGKSYLDTMRMKHQD